MKVTGTVEVTMGERILVPVRQDEPPVKSKKQTEKLLFTMEGSADAILTAIQELKRLGSFGNFDLT